MGGGGGGGALADGGREGAGGRREGAEGGREGGGSQGGGGSDPVLKLKRSSGLNVAPPTSFAAFVAFVHFRFPHVVCVNDYFSEAYSVA